MTAPRKIYQIAVIENGEGAVIYVRLDNGRIFRCFDRFEHFDLRMNATEWAELPLPPAVKPFDGDNLAPDDDDRPSRRRSY